MSNDPIVTKVTFCTDIVYETDEGLMAVEGTPDGKIRILFFNSDGGERSIDCSYLQVEGRSANMTVKDLSGPFMSTETTS